MVNRASLDSIVLDMENILDINCNMTLFRHFVSNIPSFK